MVVGFPRSKNNVWKAYRGLESGMNNVWGTCRDVEDLIVGLNMVQISGVDYGIDGLNDVELRRPVWSPYDGYGAT